MGHAEIAGHIHDLEGSLIKNFRVQEKLTNFCNKDYELRHIEITPGWLMKQTSNELPLITVWSWPIRDYIIAAKCGHVMRKEGDCLEKEIMQGTTSGARKQRKPRMRWMDNIEQWIGMQF